MTDTQTPLGPNPRSPGYKDFTVFNAYYECYVDAEK